MSRVLIIVPGAKQPHFNISFIKRVFKKILDFLSSPLGMFFSDYKKFKDYIRKDYEKVFIIKWGGDVFNIKKIEKGIEKIRKILEENKDKEIHILAFSFGGFLTEKALFNKNYQNIKKIIFSGAIHSPFINFNSFNAVYNVYSNLDNIYNLFNQLIHLDIHNFKLKKEYKIKNKKVKNIKLENLRHDELSKNVFLRNKSLYEFYRDLLLKDNI